MAQKADSTKSILFALGANSAIAVAKFVAAFITGSGAMMAEAVHSVADSGNQVLLLLGIRRAKRPPSPDYPLGTGKAIYFWSFVVAVILFSVGGMFSIYEGIHKLQEPEPLNSPLIAIGVLVFAIAAEGVSMWGCLREVNKVRRKKSYWRWFRESRQSELVVVFGEDLAALLGLCFALFALLLTMLTGNPIYDALGSVVIGVLLVVIAVALSIEVKSLLIGQGVEPEILAEMRSYLEAQEEVEQIIHILTLQLGDDVMVAVKAKMTGFASPEAMVQGINRCEKALKQQFPQVLWSFF